MKTRYIVGLVAVPAMVLAGVGYAYAGDSGHGKSVHGTVTYTEVNHPETDTDLDLGDAGLTLGDEQMFHATLQQDGTDVGDVYGVGTVVAASDTGLASQVVSTAVFSDGTFTLQLFFQMDFETGPPTTRQGAITGGTGVYAGVTGQCISTDLTDGSGNSTIVCTFK